ncbi:MAG: 3,4-dihydroxy-2-butanone-4-phosphate synthase [Planctomycetota bacterium]
MFSPIDEILSELHAGRMIVLTDDEDRENEGDLVLPVEHVTPEAVTFMLSVARGYMCLCLTESDCDRLELTPQAPSNTSVRGTAFTISVDGHPKHGFTTGVSAVERANCMKMMIDPRFGIDDFVRPGHINPLRSRDGGVLVRTGQTEGSVDLCRLAGLYPAAVIIEIMRDDGEMARLPDLEKLSRAHGLKMCSVEQIIQHRLSEESLVERQEPRTGSAIRTPHGEFTLVAYDSRVDALPHLALVMGDVSDGEPPLVRMHRRHLLGDVFGDLDSEPGESTSTSDTLHAAMRAIADEGRGVIVYLRPQGHGDDLAQRLVTPKRTHDVDINTPDLVSSHGVGAHAVPPEQREFGIGGQILRDLGVSRLRLLTNRPKKMPGIEAFGLEIVGHVSLPNTPNAG